VRKQIPEATVEQSLDRALARDDGCDADHRLRSLYRIFVILAQSTVAAEPGKCSFDNPRQTRDLAQPFRKRHILVDTLGLPIANRVEPASVEALV
jgi:hypothetical protein